MSPSDNIEQNKAIRLLNYLEELTRLRTTSVKDIASYQRTLWFNEIPQNTKYCYLRAWGPRDDFDPDIWIEIKKYDEPVLEDIPEMCEEWIDRAKLYDTASIPQLLQTIESQIEEENPDWTPEMPEDEKLIIVNRTLNIQDYPQIVTEWQSFINEKWNPWAELHKKWKEVQKVYSQLFAIHQDQLKLGEEYELVVGIGFLSWQSKQGYWARRHLVVANANLNFEARIGKFTVNPAIDGAKLSLEVDMLENEDQPAYKVREPIKDSLKSANDDLWDKGVTNPILQSLANILAEGQGEYHASDLNINISHDKSKPIISFAPALILRKRNTKSLQEVIESIREQISTGIKIPREFLDLSEGEVDRDGANHLQETVDDNGLKSVTLHPSGHDPMIYFPLPSNEKQNEIIAKFQATSGVLVQGPPGTGKSHTIANLICHLLATGQRVLVTAKTPRALKVLQEKIPDPIKPLCINLLGSGIDEQNSLESSVTNILSNHDQWNDNDADNKIERLAEKVYELRKEKARIDSQIRSIRESEASLHSILDGEYSGTASKIALRIQQEEKIYSWFKDSIPYELKCPVSIGDLVQLRNELKQLTLDKKEELKLKVPILKQDYPAPEHFIALVRDENKLIEKTKSRHEILETDLGQCFNRCEKVEAIQNLIDKILKLNASVDSVSKRPLPWVKEAVYDMLSDKDTPWKDLLQVLYTRLTGLKQKSFELEKIAFEVPNDLKKDKLLIDAKTLKQHLEKGGDLRFLILGPSAVRKSKYVCKKVSVDGHACNNIDALEKLIAFLSLQKEVDYCWSLWNGKSERKDGPLFLQIGELEELREALVEVVNLYDILHETKQSLINIAGLGEVAWHDKIAINKLLKVAQIYVSIFDLEKNQRELDNFIEKLNIFKSNTFQIHPLTDELLNAIISRDIEKYSSVCSSILQHSSLIEMFNKVNRTSSQLSDIVPNFSEELSSMSDNPAIEKCIYQFEYAWNWSRAKSWLDGLLSKDDLPSLEKRTKQIEKEIKKHIGELAALKSWKFCFSRMQDPHRRHLMGWQQAIKKIGKGTGKHASKHRRDAQIHLNECRDAVPAWIMPLHRVYETVSPKPEVFDVIIVDEASQCGPEALPLLFLSKKIIVVGDDQQISPDAVGITSDKVHMLMEEYLYDFAHADSFAPDSSLFDHGKRRFNNRIVLREHFRCMPEIIRFSNDLCYNSTPLIPLRQYPPNRLEPLITVHVPQGFREGGANRAINRPEAEIIVDKIIQCCNDEQYEDKTMGVVVLQGEAQGALIESMLLEQLGAEEMERRRLICGNPYSFQGDERHIIFLSMVAAPNERIGAFTKPSDQRRFNVAASRAQDQMWLFHSVEFNDLSQFCLRKALLEHFKNPKSQITNALGEGAEELQKLAFSANRQIEKPPSPFDSWFELDVALKIASKGYRVVPQFPFAGKRIDLVIEGNKSKLAVECDGDNWHGIEEYEADTERQRTLERSGWQFLRIRECSFNSNPDKSLESLWYELGKFGIMPVKMEMSIAELEEPENKTAELKQTNVSLSLGQRELFSKVILENEPIIKSGIKTIHFENIQQVLAMKSSNIRSLIAVVLSKRPNFSCIKDALPGLILKELEVVSRGKPREEFSRKVNQAVRYLEKAGSVEIYKSKNVRVRLISSED